VFAATTFTGKTFVLRIDAATAGDPGTTLIDDLHVLRERSITPIVVAPDPGTARDLVRAINRSTNLAIALSGSDAALIPSAPSGIGKVQTRILYTLTGAGFIPVVEPTAFALFEDGDCTVAADDVASAIAAATDAARAIFFHQAGGVPDPQTLQVIDELTPAEALALAEDPRVAPDLRDAMRAAALGVRSGVPAAQIVDGRIPHAAVMELLTAHHAGTQVIGGLILAG
jgi:acetylglutamate kinase